MLDATLELLEAEGAGGCSVEAVAARSGVAKTTIYRQFEGREDLIFAVLEEQKPPVVAPYTGDVIADLEVMLLELAGHLTDAASSRMLASMIDLAERSERANDLAHEFGARRRAVLATRIETAVRHGELVPAVDVEVACAQLAGPLLYRRYLSREPLTDDFVNRLVRSTLGPWLSDRSVVAAAGAGSPR